MIIAILASPTQEGGAAAAAQTRWEDLSAPYFVQAAMHAARFFAMRK